MGGKILDTRQAFSIRLQASGGWATEKGFNVKPWASRRGAPENSRVVPSAHFCFVDDRGGSKRIYHADKQDTRHALLEFGKTIVDQ